MKQWNVVKVMLILGGVFFSILFGGNCQAKEKSVSMKEYRTIKRGDMEIKSVSKSQKGLALEIYKQIKDTSKESLIIPYSSNRELKQYKKAFFALKGSYFYYEEFTPLYVKTGETTGYISIDTEKCRECLKRNNYIKKEIKKIVKKLKITKKTSEKDAIRKINNYMVENFNYDYSYSNGSAYQLLKEKTGVCAAYADLFKDICGYIGIQAKNVIDTQQNHEWNIVRCNKRWYYVDVTWNDCFGTNRYLLMSGSVLNNIGEYTIDYTRPVLVVRQSACIN